jgi:hypothetical protein
LAKLPDHFRGTAASSNDKEGPLSIVILCIGNGGTEE